MTFIDFVFLCDAFVSFLKMMNSVLKDIMNQDYIWYRAMRCQFYFQGGRLGESELGDLL